MTDQVRVGVIGTGGFTDFAYLTNLKSHPQARLSAICCPMVMEVLDAGLHVLTWPWSSHYQQMHRVIVPTESPVFPLYLVEASL